MARFRFCRRNQELCGFIFSTDFAIISFLVLSIVLFVLYILDTDKEYQNIIYSIISLMVIYLFYFMFYRLLH